MPKACATYPFKKPMPEATIAEAWSKTMGDISANPMQVIKDSGIDDATLRDLADEALITLNPVLHAGKVLTPGQEDLMQQFDSLLADVLEISEPVTLYSRSLGINPAFLEPGTILRDKGYFSAINGPFEDFPGIGDTPIKVIVPAGTQVSALKTVDPDGNAAIESILARNTDFRVLGVDDTGTLNLEVLPNPADLTSAETYGELILKNPTAAMKSAAGEEFELIGVPAAAQKKAAQKLGLDPSVYPGKGQWQLPTLPNSAPPTSAVVGVDDLGPFPEPIAPSYVAAKPLIKPTPTNPTPAPTALPKPKKVIVDPEISPKGYVWQATDGKIFKTKKAAAKHIEKVHPTVPNAVPGSVPQPPAAVLPVTGLGQHEIYESTARTKAVEASKKIFAGTNRAYAGSVKENLERQISARLVRDLPSADDWAKRLKIESKTITHHGRSVTLREYRNLSPDDYVSYVRARVYEHSRTWIDTWASTSGDDHIHALMMQRAAALEFGLDVSYIDNLMLRKFQTKGLPPFRNIEDLMNSQLSKSSFARQRGLNFTAAEYTEQYRPFLRAMYENTQDYFRAAGITHVRMYRGMGLPVSALGAKNFTDLQTIVSQYGGHIPAEIVFQPMSSFSTSKATAEGFANGTWYMGGQGVSPIIGEWQAKSPWKNVTVPVLIETEVPVSMLVGSALTGFGCLNEKELVALASGGKVRIITQTPRVSPGVNIDHWINPPA